ncbi:MAG TPA: sigma 54-interacting transcriptional regulator [Terriglobales bacterium]
MADIAAVSCGLSELMATVSTKLCEIVGSEIVIYSIHDAVRETACHCVWRSGTLTRGSYPSKDCLPLAQEWGLQQPLLVQDVGNEQGFPQVITTAKEAGMGSFCGFPLSTGTRQLGALIFGSPRTQAYRENDLVFLGGIARLITMMIENGLALATLQKEKACITKVCASLFSDRPLDGVLPMIADPVREVMGQDFTSMLMHDRQRNCLQLRHLDFTVESPEPEPAIPVGEFPCWPVFSAGEIRRFSLGELRERNPRLAERMEKLGILSLLLVPVVNRSGVCAILALSSRRENAFATKDHDFLGQIAARIAAAMERDAAGEEIAGLTQKLDEGMGRLEQERLYLEEEIRSSHNFDEIIGESAKLRHALAQVQTVAPSDATVLVLGETGTGKELIARAIHRMSARRGGSFIKLNCAAIPTGLLESELFGHEKGAFTGAVTQKVGRLELADGGTLFLDEVGDIPLELQPKLLRVLQDQEFERLGGVRTIKVNVRLVAATNRDLPKQVAAGEFRSDLFYRLYVFPIRLPSLRERASDIPRLVRYFIQKFARRMGKHIDTIPADVMNALVSWGWPGNVRELENFVERSVLLTPGRILRVPIDELHAESGDLSRETNLHSIEREHILRVLRETGGVIAGIHGAAARLGMKRTTLQSRMQRMGISREDYEK